jgi:sulfur-oxidizing protein SoxZ
MAEKTETNNQGKVSAHSMRMSAKLKDKGSKDAITEVKLIVNHPMETGRKKDDFGALIPAHFIQLLNVSLNGQTVFESQMGTGIAKNPYITFRLKNAKLGDKLETTWLDNLGETGTGETLVVAA